VGILSLRDQLFAAYGLTLQEVRFYGREWLTDGNRLYLLRDLSQFHHPDLRELQYYSEALFRRGESVAYIVPTKTNETTAKIADNSVVLLLLNHPDRPLRTDGKTLAHFHQVGTALLSESPSRHYLLSGWRDFWAKRIDDLSMKWNDVEQKNVPSDYETLFLEIFPYFSGRAENAIQYVTDLFIDVPVTDQPVIAHHRFNEECWRLDGFFSITPDQWVIDHPARDLAEWMRRALLQNRSTSDIFAFVDQYVSQRVLSVSGLGLIFSRLLYPLLFIENAEAFFDGRADEQKALAALHELLEQTDREERFLAAFGKRYMKTLPRIDWLADTVKSSL